MRHLNNLSEWFSRQGSYEVSLEAGRTRGVFIGQDNNLLALADDRTVLLFSGTGRFEIDFYSASPVSLAVQASGDDVWSSLQLRGWHHDAYADAGWENGNSFAQLDPKPRNQVTPEVAAMFEQMQKNMLARENKLRQELERRLLRGSD